MKRIFIVVLCVALAVCALAVPASASIYEDRWVNVLEFATVDDSGGNTFAFNNGSSFSLSVPGGTIVHDIDILFRSNYAPTSVTVVRDSSRQFPLTLVSIGSNLYRAYGSCKGYEFESLQFKLGSSYDYDVYGELLQCRVSSLTVDFKPVGADITKINLTGPGKHNAGSDTTVFNISTSDDFELLFDIGDWRNYDYIDFAYRLTNVTIDSISAYIGDRSIPVKIQSYDSDPLGNSSKMICGYLDIYGVDHDGSNTLTIAVTGTHYNDSVGSVWLSWLNGAFHVESPSIWANIWSSIKNGFKAVGDWLSSGFNSVVNAIKEAFGGLADEQEHTNDILDDALNKPKPSIKPEGSDVVDSVIDAESKLENDLHIDSSVNDYKIYVDDAVISLWEHIAGFVMVSELLTMFVNIAWINDIVRVSAALGLVSFVTNLIQTIISKAGKGSSSSKKGGNSSD